MNVQGRHHLRQLGFLRRHIEPAGVTFGKLGAQDAQAADAVGNGRRKEADAGREAGHQQWPHARGGGMDHGFSGRAAAKPGLVVIGDQQAIDLPLMRSNDCFRLLRQQKA